TGHRNLGPRWENCGLHPRRPPTRSHLKPGFEGERMLHIGKCPARSIVFVLRRGKSGSQLLWIYDPQLSQDRVSEQGLEIAPLALGRPGEEAEQDALANPSS